MKDFFSWATLIAVISFVAQQIFKTWLDYRKYRSEIVFSKMHEDRAEVVKQIFQKLTVLHQTLFDFTRAVKIVDENVNYEEHQQKLANLFNNAYVDARNFISLNGIYLSKELCNKIENLISEIRGSAIDYNFSDKDIRESIRMRDAQFINEKRELCRNIRDKVEIDMQKLLNELEIEFRKLLGVK